MLDIQIDGIYTYVDNVKNLKLGDKIKLILNPNNRINVNAIGAYTLDNKKIGYVPFKVNQIDINLIYTVSKISLNQNNPLLLISINFNNSNFILIDNKQDLSIKIINDDVKKFRKYLERNGHEIQDIFISNMDDNYIDLTIKSNNDSTIFNTVSKQYYESHIFKYNEFYQYKLINHCIYQPFLIHRLESYIIKQYNPINKLVKKNNKKLNELNLTFDIINDNDILNLFEDINSLSLCYNHNMKAYCYINFYNNDTIFDIIYNDEYNNVPIYLIKLLISNKKNMILYNPSISKIYKLELNEIILEKLSVISGSYKKNV
jgi:hypothetical protein